MKGGWSGKVRRRPGAGPVEAGLEDDSLTPPVRQALEEGQEQRSPAMPACRARRSWVEEETDDARTSVLRSEGPEKKRVRCTCGLPSTPMAT